VLRVENRINPCAPACFRIYDQAARLPLVMVAGGKGNVGNAVGFKLPRIGSFILGDIACFQVCAGYNIRYFVIFAGIDYPLRDGGIINC